MFAWSHTLFPTTRLLDLDGYVPMAFCTSPKLMICGDSMMQHQ